MLLKWIVCEVPEADRDRFATAQEEWKHLATAPGFIAQLGGWEETRPQLACVLGLWVGEGQYRSFMNELHDGIVEKSGQGSVYRQCATALFDSVSEIPGENGSLVGALAEGKVLRVARCTLRPGREEHFTEMQDRFWTPGMSETSGMLGGMFSKRREKETPEYLVTTVWRDEESHRHYQKRRLPHLRTETKVEEDVENLEGFLVPFERRWGVTFSDSV